MKPFYFILLLAWFILGFFLCKSKLCPSSNQQQLQTIVEPATDSTDDCVSAILFKNGDDFKLVSKENFKFLRSNYDYNILSFEFEEKLLKVAKYLDENPNVKMKIKGLFLKDENDPTEYENLGLARAYKVKTYFLTLGVNPSQLLTSAKLANPDCFVDDTLEKGIVVAFDD